MSGDDSTNGPDVATAPTGHYFSDQPTVASKVSRLPVALPDLSFELDADRGVFSGSQIDAGTRLLLIEGCRPEPDTTVLDLGCGYGPIACSASMRTPSASVWAVDVNERALALCRSNAARLGLANVNVGAPDDVDSAVRFDLIVSNPPIRVGKAKLHEMLERWLDRLTPNGHAELVVQKHLGSDSLQRWLTDHGWPTERVLSRGGYRILRSEARTS